MGQQAAAWGGGQNQQLWLSMLVDAMEEAARPDVRARPCAPAVLAGLRAQLSRPVSHHPFAVSAFSLRNWS
jgi:hypothetical protein